MKYQLEELSIEITNKCLMKCRHCSSGASPLALPNELTPSEINRLLREARELGATILSISGGDPVTQPENSILYVMEALRLGYEQVLYYTTGLTVVGPPMLGIYNSILYDMPKDDKVIFVYSLESQHPEVNDYIMGRPGAWDMITRNIKDTISHGFRVWVHMVPMLPNWENAPGLWRMLESMHVEKMSMLRFVPQTRGRTNNKKLGLDAEAFSDMQYILVDMSSSAWKCNTDLRLGCPIDFRHTVDPLLESKAHVCHAGKDLILVRPQGDVHPCAAWKTLPDTDNVRDKSLKEIWEHGKIFQVMREFHEGKYLDIGGICKLCRYRESCESGCSAQRLHHIAITKYRDATIEDLYQPIPDPLCPHVREIAGCLRQTT